MNLKGFTLIELVVALGVGTVILFGVVGSLFMILREVPDLREDVVAIADIESAAHWLTRDVAMGRDTDLVDSAPPVAQMTISWSDLTKAAEEEGTVLHSVTYTWSSETGELERNYNGVTTIVGTHLTNAGFSFTNRSVTVTLTSSISEGSGSVVTRTYKILMRGESGL